MSRWRTFPLPMRVAMARPALLSVATTAVVFTWHCLRNCVVSKALAAPRQMAMSSASPLLSATTDCVLLTLSSRCFRGTA